MNALSANAATFQSACRLSPALAAILNSRPRSAKEFGRNSGLFVIAVIRPQQSINSEPSD